MLFGSESRGCLLSRLESRLRARGGVGWFIEPGDCCCGISKNEAAFIGGLPSRSILPGVSFRGCDFTLGDDFSRVSDLVGIFSSFGLMIALGVEAKWERFPCPRLKAFGPSVCLLKAAKSELASSGRCLGDAAPNERMDDEGGLQLPFGPAPESRGWAWLAGSTISPK